MSLNKEDNIIASRIVLEATRYINEATRKTADAEKHLHERHLRDGRNALLDAGGALRRLAVHLEDLRKMLGLQDPADARRGELTERFQKAQSDLRKAENRKLQLTDAGEDDPNILVAVDTVITRYRQAVLSVRSEMEADGWNPMEITALESAQTK